MKKIIISALILLPSILFAQSSNVQDYEQRLQDLNSFKSNVSKYEDNNTNLFNKVESYNHLHMIKADEKKIEHLGKRLTELNLDIKKNASLIYPGHLPKKIAKLKEVVSERQKYLHAIEENKEIGKGSYHTKRFYKFMMAIKDQKTIKADIILKLLPTNEVELAKKYNQNHIFKLRNDNMQKHHVKNINSLSQEIEKAIAKQEVAMDNIRYSSGTNQLLKSKLEQLKVDHEKPQVDLTINQFESGMFNCKEVNTPKLYRYKHFPNYIALKNNGKLKSILDISMPQSKEANYAYACKKLSMFGGCLENVKKEVCKISDNCNQSLENMEKSYTENDFFGATKNDFLEHLNEKRKIDIIEGASIDIISEWNNSSGLGDLKKQDLDNKFEELIKEAKYLKSNSPSEFLYAMKRKIKASKKKLTANFKKSEIHSKVIDYFHNNLNSFFETLVNSEKLQSFSFSQCGLNEKVSKEFCSNYIKWNQDYSVFEELEEVNNLAADECPRVVLRIDVKESFTTAKDGSCKHNGSYTNGIENFKALEKSTSKIIKKME